MVAPGPFQCIGYLAGLEGKNRLFKLSRPGTLGNPAQLSALFGGAGILRFAAGQFGKRGRIGLRPAGDVLGLGQRLVALGLCGARRNADLYMADIDAGRLYVASLVLLVVLAQFVVADLRQVCHGSSLVEQQVIGAYLLGKLKALFVLVVPGLDIGIGNLDVFFVFGRWIGQIGRASCREGVEWSLAGDSRI